MAHKVTFYNAWFCPFAQRAWIGLLHKGIKFEYVEQDPYNKSPEWLAINPRGLVPAIRHNGHVVYESPICLEYTDEAWKDEGPALLPKDPYERALVRIWSDHISKKIVPAYYAVLLKRTEEERTEAKVSMEENLFKLQDAMASDGGPFFMGYQFGMVDVMLFPHFYRIQTIVKQYRAFSISDEVKFERLLKWYNAVKGLECVKQTMADEERLIAKYKRYENDTAETEVATAIRKGTALP